jgi:2-polyprenyl-6-hydroxyphenyl methylase/3-demethylubiquinone-9 3-methyltransferase
MAVGSKVRKLFGRHERLIADLWRGIFMSLDHWTCIIGTWAPQPRRILELGCGEGCSTIRLAAAYPDAVIDAVDIAAHVGRLYQGPADRVRFRIVTAEDLAQECPNAYDLIIVTDVLHHIPQEARGSFLAAVRGLLAPGGVLAFKDWHRNWAPIYYLGYAADRWLTGDRIAYLTRAEARHLLAGVFGANCVSAEQTIAPWFNNYAIKICAR